MSKVTAQISVSLDGFAAGPNQSLENPLGENGERLHEWALATKSWNEQHGREGGEETPDDAIVRTAMENVGAFIMGRNMFGGGPGPWDESWKGWWGEEPPFHAPVLVLTHHPRPPLETKGGTTFTFVTDGIEAALADAREKAGNKDVAIAGGASTINQYLGAGLLDELHLHIAPTILGSGERLLEDVGDPTLEPIEVVASPAATHIKYRITR
ncbi:MAG TPA: dihydrofolate reductase family protein [Thermoleophilaceae bacterium]|nr:dihydrofolate reductase family protein [Thermoleophilaceae bacterium]